MLFWCQGHCCTRRRLHRSYTTSLNCVSIYSVPWLCSEQCSSRCVSVMKLIVRRVVVLWIVVKLSLLTTRLTAVSRGTFSDTLILSLSWPGHKLSTLNCRRQPRLTTLLFAGGNQLCHQVVYIVCFSFNMFVFLQLCKISIYLSCRYSPRLCLRPTAWSIVWIIWVMWNIYEKNCKKKVSPRRPKVSVTAGISEDQYDTIRYDTRV